MILFVKKTESLREKVIGLIGKEKPVALMIRTRFGIHTFGLKFPIDVLILNRNNKVVKIKQSLGPNNIFIWNPMYNKVLELPEQTINKKKIKVHSLIDLKII